MKKKNNILPVQNIPVAIVSDKSNDFISLTDIAKYRNSTEPFSIGCETELALNSMGFGRNFINQILN